jgi:hypothetical protein
MNTSAEQGIKTHDDPVHQITELMEKWKNRPTLDNLRLSERYLNEEFYINLHCLFTGASGNVAKFCAVCEYHKSTVNIDGETPIGVKIGQHYPKLPPSLATSPRECGVNMNESLSESANDHHAMLINSVKIMERPEAIVTTLVRLYCLDEFYGKRLNSLYLVAQPPGFFVGHNCLFELGQSLTDGKHGALVRLSPVDQDKLPNEMIQRAPQVMYGIADHAGEIMRNLGSDFDPENLILGLRILVCDDGAIIGLAKGVSQAFKITDVVFGPFDFRANAD